MKKGTITQSRFKNGFNDTSSFSSKLNPAHPTEVGSLSNTWIVACSPVKSQLCFIHLSMFLFFIFRSMGRRNTTGSRGRTYLKSNEIEKKVSTDPTRHCIDTYNQTIKIHVRITSTVKVIRASMFIMWSVLEVTQRVPPTHVQ